jgi:hypothetical protein
MHTALASLWDWLSGQFTLGNILTIVGLVVSVYILRSNTKERIRALEVLAEGVRSDVKQLTDENNEVPKSLLLGRLDDLKVELRQHIADDREIQDRISQDLISHREGEKAFYIKMERLIRKLTGS